MKKNPTNHSSWLIHLDLLGAQIIQAKVQIEMETSRSLPCMLAWLETANISLLQGGGGSSEILVSGHYGFPIICLEDTLEKFEETTQWW